MLRRLFSKEEIREAVWRLGREIEEEYRGRCPILVGILKGSFIFLADLVRTLSIPVEIDFIRAASYGRDTISSGEVSILKDIELSIKGRDVLLVEDIVDTGITLQVICNHLREKGPSSLKVCALIDKKVRREVDVVVDFVGFEVEEGFLVGYGLDWGERYRHLPEIYVLEES